MTAKNTWYRNAEDAGERHVSWYYGPNRENLDAVAIVYPDFNGSTRTPSRSRVQVHGRDIGGAATIGEAKKMAEAALAKARLIPAAPEPERKSPAQLDREIAAALPTLPALPSRTGRGIRKAMHGAGGLNAESKAKYRARPKSGRHWEVLAMIPQPGRGEIVKGLIDSKGFIARCGHRHATKEEATMCPWTPDPWPEVCDLFVAIVRTPDENTKPEQARMF